MDYLVEMNIIPPSTIPNPQEGIAFTERYVLPSLEICQRLRTTGKIIGGGPVVGALAFSLLVRAESPQEIDDLLGTLPLWPRSKTTLTPLTSFESRATAVRQKLEAAKATLSAVGGTAK